MKKFLQTIKVITDWLMPLNFSRLIKDIKNIWK